MNVPVWVCILIAVLSAAAAGFVAFGAGVSYRKKQAEAAIGSAEQEAKRIVSDAIKTSEAKKKRPFWRARTRFTVCAPNRKKNSTTAARKSSGRNAVYSKRKRLWTER